MVERVDEFVPPGPGRGDPEAKATAAASDAGGCVQQPVAQLLWLGGGQLSLPQQGLGPGEQVGGGEGQLQPCLVEGEVTGDPHQVDYGATVTQRTP